MTDPTAFGHGTVQSLCLLTATPRSDFSNLGYPMMTWAEEFNNCQSTAGIESPETSNCCGDTDFNIQVDNYSSFDPQTQDEGIDCSLQTPVEMSPFELDELTLDQIFFPPCDQPTISQYTFGFDVREYSSQFGIPQELCYEPALGDEQTAEVCGPVPQYFMMQSRMDDQSVEFSGNLDFPC